MFSKNEKCNGKAKFPTQHLDLNSFSAQPKTLKFLYVLQNSVNEKLP